MATTYFLLFVSRFQQIFPPSYSYMPFPSLSPISISFLNCTRRNGPRCTNRDKIVKAITMSGNESI